MWKEATLARVKLATVEMDCLAQVGFHCSENVNASKFEATGHKYDRVIKDQSNRTYQLATSTCRS